MICLSDYLSVSRCVSVCVVWFTWRLSLSEGFGALVLQTNTVTGRCQDLLAPSRSLCVDFFFSWFQQIALYSPFINNRLGLVMIAPIFTDITASMKKDVRPSRTVKIEIIITFHLLFYHEMLLNHAHWAFQFHSAHQQGFCVSTVDRWKKKSLQKRSLGPNCPFA